MPRNLTNPNRRAMFLADLEAQSVLEKPQSAMHSKMPRRTHGNAQTERRGFTTHLCGVLCVLQAVVWAGVIGVVLLTAYGLWLAVPMPW